jgi:hypothetical protein
MLWPAHLRGAEVVALAVPQPFSHPHANAPCNFWVGLTRDAQGASRCGAVDLVGTREEYEGTSRSGFGRCMWAPGGTAVALCRTGLTRCAQWWSAGSVARRWSAIPCSPSCTRTRACTVCATKRTVGRPRTHACSEISGVSAQSPVPPLARTLSHYQRHFIGVPDDLLVRGRIGNGTSRRMLGSEVRAGGYPSHQRELRKDA